MTMDFSMPAAAAAPAPPPADLIRDSSTAGFRADVLEASLKTPVLVDFWAPWCGPCRQLTPALEKVVTELKGKVRLVKINVDENQALAGQMGVQSIPAVFAFSGGRPVDGFMGALPEGQIRQFVERVLQAAGPSPDGSDELAEQVAGALAAADAALAEGDAARAAEVYALVAQNVPDNIDAVLGLARAQAAAGDLEAARATLDTVPADKRSGPAYEAAAASLALAEEAAGVGEAASLARAVEAEPGNLQARFDLAIALNAEGRRLEAAEALVELIRRDRDWGEDAARKKLLEFFEAWGPKDPASARGRRLLSALLFS